MALIKTRVHHKNASGTYDTFHYETSADVVLYTNNSQTTVSGALDNLFSGKSNSNHTHGNITNAGLLATGSRAVITDSNKKITVQDNTVADPTASGTSTEFINAASQSSTGKITVTKANLPTASTSVAGITKLGASGGAATYAHNHDTTYAPITHNHSGAEITTGTVGRARLQAMTGASASAAGVGGAVPAPAAGDNTKFLRGDGTWVVPTDTKYTPASTSPKMDGTAAVGTSAKYAREDHVHPTDTSRAAASHTHSSNDITALDASKITTGTISIDRLPAAALERVVTVANQAARFALTTNSVQLGDVVKQTDTGIMYYVTNESKLNQAAGYTEFTAGQAAAVPWSGITDKPSSFTPASHTHSWLNITNTPSTYTPSSHTHNITDIDSIFGICTTAAATAAKTVSIPGITYLDDGTTIRVRFTNANTVDYPTLNVNSFGAKPIWAWGQRQAASTAGTSWPAHAVINFTYNGSAWVMNDSQMGGYKISTDSIGSASAGTAIAADDITAWSAGTTPSLTITNTACDDITAWSAGTATKTSVSGGELKIEDGTAPSLSYTARSIGSASGWSAGTLPSLTYTARSIPNISVTSKTVVSGLTRN